jgi:P-type Cu2+ transporter
MARTVWPAGLGKEKSVNTSPSDHCAREQSHARASGAAGHHAHHDGHDHEAMIADFRRRFWVSLALTVPILLLSPMIQRFLGLDETLAFPADLYVLFGLASVVYFWGSGRSSKASPGSLRHDGPA